MQLVVASMLGILLHLIPRCSRRCVRRWRQNVVAMLVRHSDVRPGDC